jgi:hypothetical protein
LIEHLAQGHGLLRILGKEELFAGLEKQGFRLWRQFCAMLEELARISILLDEHPEVCGNYYAGSGELRGASSLDRVHISEGSIDAREENVRSEIDCRLESLGAMSSVAGVVDSDPSEVKHNAQRVWGEFAVISIDRVYRCLAETIGVSFFKEMATIRRNSLLIKLLHALNRTGKTSRRVFREAGKSIGVHMIEMLVCTDNQVSGYIVCRERTGHHALESDESFNDIGEVGIDVDELIVTGLESESCLAKPVHRELAGSNRAAKQELFQFGHFFSHSNA